MVPMGFRSRDLSHCKPSLLTTELKEISINQLSRGGYEPTTLTMTLGRGALLLHLIGESERLLFNVKWAIFSYIIARISYIQWDDNVIRFVLDQRNWLEFL